MRWQKYYNKEIMKILLILPDGKIHKLKFGSFEKSMREAPLTMTVLAALVPKELNAEIKIVDESIDTIPENFKADIVGISVLTGTANRAYEIADYYRKKKVTVVLGGVHVTTMPEEAKNFADSIVIGNAEKAWPKLLKDFSKGKLQTRYKESEAKKFTYPTPFRFLQKNRKYIAPNTVMATRGCVNQCEFCTVPALGQKYCKRDVGEVIKDIQSFKSRRFVFNDVSLVDDLEYAKELFTELIPLKKRWGGLATTKIIKYPEIIELMAKSGCRYLLIGFESFQKNALKEINKGFNKEEEYKKLMEILHAYNISVQGCFIFGFDNDDKEIFEKTVQLVNELKIDIPRYSILTPYPGTKLFQRLSEEKRIINYDWSDYDTTNVVFKPQKMSPEELYEGYKYAYRKTFKLSHIINRSAGFHFSNVINFFGNLNYKKFSRRLQKCHM